MDRLTSVGISNTAKEFLDAAKILREKDPGLLATAQEFSNKAKIPRANEPDRFDLSNPIYFCICQSIELSLKAFLLGSGYTEEKLRNKIGHDLVKAIKKARKLNLDVHFKFSSNDKELIRVINRYYQGKDLQYMISGIKHYPCIEQLVSLGELLWRETRDFCISNQGFHERKDTEL